MEVRTLGPLYLKSITLTLSHHERIEMGGQGVQTLPEKSQNIGFLSNTGPVPWENRKPAFNVGPPSAPQRNDDDGGMMMACF